MPQSKALVMTDLYFKPEYIATSTRGDQDYFYAEGFAKVNISAERGGLTIQPASQLLFAPNVEYELIRVHEAEITQAERDDNPNSILEYEQYRQLRDAPSSGGPTFPSKPRVPQSHESDESWSWIEGLLETCLGEHNDCHLAKGTYAPTRVLDLGRDVTKIFLTDGQATTGKYACVSHTWGQTQQIRTLKENLAKHIKGIELSELSKTFKDAIVVARRLKIRYLWIDSLCIIQNDELDWQREAATMCDVYSNAYLTIAATGAKDGLSGCFIDVEPEVHGYQVPSLDEPVVFRRAPIHEMYLGKPPDTYRLGYLTEHLPLFRRAWVYQERILSPRVIHFGPELVWECRTHTQCSCHYLNTSTETWKQSHQPSLKRDIDFGGVKNDDWSRHVQAYTILQLTKPGDILPAISGVAQLYAATHENLGRYFAGLWESNMVRHLAWRPQENRCRERIESWRAPSWSWASQLANVEFMLDESLPLVCHVLSAECKTKNDEPYGELISGTVVLDAPCFDVTLQYDASVEWHQGSEEVIDLVYNGKSLGITYGALSWDYFPDDRFRNDVPPGSEVLFLVLNDRGWIFGLCLSRSKSNPGAYERIGFIASMHYDYSPLKGNAIRRTVTIV
ncbi:MAG: hypothetical protein Q9165_006230 [Trypethelium subeluteriae]